MRIRDVMTCGAWLLTLALPVTCNADLVGGTTPEIAPPPNIAGGGIDNFRRIFLERSTYVTEDPIQVDHLSALVSPGQLQEIVSPASSTRGTIPTGSTVNVYYFYIDPTEPFPILDPGSWTVIFELSGCSSDSPQVGLAFSRVTLEATDALGSPQTDYPQSAASRGIESPDTVMLTLGPCGVLTIAPTLDGADRLDGVRIFEIVAGPQSSATEVRIPTTGTLASVALFLILTWRGCKLIRPRTWAKHLTSR